MIIKEEDAKKRICHQTFSAPEVHSPNDNVRQAGPWTCVGSECMAWRWQKRSFGLGGQPFGYCGLAGDPEQ